MFFIKGYHSNHNEERMSHFFVFFLNRNTYWTFSVSMEDSHWRLIKIQSFEKNRLTKSCIQIFHNDCHDNQNYVLIICFWYESQDKYPKKLKCEQRRIRSRNIKNSHNYHMKSFFRFSGKRGRCHLGQKSQALTQI